MSVSNFLACFAFFVNGEVAEAAEVNANFSALADPLDVTVPHSFANSGIADANEVNSNFTALKTAVDLFTNDLAAATGATDTAFSNGYSQGVVSVDITTDNAEAEAVAAAAAGSAACTQAGGSWDGSTSTCTPGGLNLTGLNLTGATLTFADLNLTDANLSNWQAQDFGTSLGVRDSA